ncbi:50S ribosomal protein L10 [Ferroplasma sp.]|uniref:50S ribosomal protein L10 n=1 Tax=Ferroplasma sp. TaxID=2591003 RepID=UPI00307E9AB5
MREPAQWKVDMVNSLTEELNESPVSAVISISGLRNKEFQKIRNDLRGEVQIKVLRSRLLRFAMEKSNKSNIAGLTDYAYGQIALLTTKQSPKKVYDILVSKRTKAAARGGEIAEEDIVIEPRETSFPPGPMISVFQKVGISAGIEKGKIVIKSEVTLVKKGESISKEKAQVLEKLEILPVTVGLEMIAAYEDGLVYTKDALSITIEQIVSDMAGAFLKAKAIALETGFMVPEIMPELLSKAYLQAQSLAIAANFVDEKNIDIFIRKAVINATTLNSLINKDINNENIENKTSKESKTEEKKDKGSEDDAAAGLGSLFG